MISWKALILSRVGLFVVVVTLGMSSGLTDISAKMSAGFIIFCGIDVGTWARTS